MIKRILTALDRDTDTPVAIQYAIRLAETFDASLTGLAVVDVKNIYAETGGGGIGTIYYADMMRSQLTEEARMEACELLDNFDRLVNRSNVRHATHVGEGVPYEGIIEELKYHDLLIIGRESHFFYNRPNKDTKTLAEVVKKSSAPALVIMESYQPVEKVLIAYDGSVASARATQWFVQLEPYGRRIDIELVHVCDTANSSACDQATAMLHVMSDFLKSHGYETINQQLLDREGSVGAAIIGHVRETGADLVVMGAHSVSAVRRMTFGSTTHDLVTESPVPVFMSN